MKSKLIGLYGNAGAGKDTVALHLLSVYGTAHCAFADQLRWTCAELFNAPVELFRDTALKDLPSITLFGRTPREVLKLVGTNLVRDTFGADHWIKVLDSVIYERYATEDTIVISDVSFLNEIKYVLDNGGTIWYIKRPGHNTVRIREDDYNQAQTFIETMVLEGNPYVRVIENDGNLGEFFERISAEYDQVTETIKFF